MNWGEFKDTFVLGGKLYSSSLSYCLQRERFLLSCCMLLLRRLCASVTDSDGFSVFSASPLPFEQHLVWPQIRAYIFAHKSPQSLHLAFIEAVDSDTCLPKSSAEN